MRVFVTGATGFVGSAVVQDLIERGHQVLGLARSKAACASLRAAGVDVHQGTLNEPDSLRHAVALSDAVVHTAFDHDFSRYQANCETDREAIVAMGDVLVGSDRPLIVTSAIGILPSGQRVTEDIAPITGLESHPRTATEEAADAVAQLGVNISVVRLPPSVHGQGDHGFIPTLIAIAREKRAAAYIGEGINRWPAVHRLDAARLYRLALETDADPGTRYHAVSEEGVAFRDIAAAIGRGLGVPLTTKSPEEAAAHFGWFARFAAMDIEACSEWTRQRLDWRPVQPGLLNDLGGQHYFPA